MSNKTQQPYTKIAQLEKALAQVGTNVFNEVLLSETVITILKENWSKINTEITFDEAFESASKSAVEKLTSSFIGENNNDS